MFHLNVRVAWHDNRWNGTVCNDPLGNSYLTYARPTIMSRMRLDAPRLATLLNETLR